MKKISLIFIFILIFSFKNHGQINSLSVGIAGGFGETKGNSPSQTSFILNGFVEFSPSFWNDIDFRFDYSYMRKLESLFPDNNIYCAINILISNTNSNYIMTIVGNTASTCTSFQPKVFN